MPLKQHLASVADTAPFPHPAHAAEKIGLNAHPVEPPHVERRADPIEIDCGRKYLQLLRFIVHLAVQSNAITIPGVRPSFHNVLSRRRNGHSRPLAALFRAGAGMGVDDMCVGQPEAFGTGSA